MTDTYIQGILHLHKGRKKGVGISFFIEFDNQNVITPQSSKKGQEQIEATRNMYM